MPAFACRQTRSLPDPVARRDASRTFGRSLMWCTSCRQDVPGLVDGVDGAYGCARCGTALLNDSGIDLSADAPETPRRTGPHEPVSEYRDDLQETIPFEPAAPPQPEPSRISTLRWDAANWELNEKLRHVERLTAEPRAASSTRHPSGSHARHDAAASRFPPPHYPVGEAVPPSFEPSRFEPYSPVEAPEFEPLDAPYVPSYQPMPAHPHAPHGPAGTPPAHNSAPAWIAAAASLASWLFLGLAVGTFCCGGFLAGWGAVAGRPELEQLGMPIILGGMLAMVLGLLPQIFLRRIEESHAAESRLDHPRTGRRSGAEFISAEYRHGPHADYGRRESRRPESAYYR